MKVFKSFDEAEFNNKSVITVGTFDGVHQGHQSVINELLNIGQSENLRPVLLTIHPHPQEIIRKDRDPSKLLTSINERLVLFERFGIPNVLIIPFDYAFSLTTPEIFVRKYLHEKLGFEKILIGYDHLFGKNREGNSELLHKLSTELNFCVKDITPISDRNIIVSSTKIRCAIKDCDIEFANEMLGYDYIVNGKVMHGQKIAATLGYPTANIYPDEKNKLMPGNGVYLVSSVINGDNYYGMANVGLRPTLTNDTIPTLEVNYFDLDMDLYDKYLTVSFHKFIRKEVKFAGIEKLIEQISNDKTVCISLIKDIKN